MESVDTRQKQIVPVDENNVVINAAGQTISMHPRVAGVTVTIAYGASASVAATGRGVTITVVSGTTTVGAVQTLIAASAAAAALLSLSGTASAVFASPAGAGTYSLFVHSAAPPNVPIVLDVDGNWRPVEADATYGAKVSLSSRIAGEDVVSDRMLVMPKYSMGSGGILTASGTLHNAACVVRRLVVRETGGSSAITVVLRDGGGGGTVKTVTYNIAAGGWINEQLDLAFGTDVYLSVTGGGTPSAVAYVQG